jgi:hypothetical protein
MGVLLIDIGSDKEDMEQTSNRRKEEKDARADKLCSTMTAVSL